MRQRMPETLLVTLLRRCYSISSCRHPNALLSFSQKRSIHHTRPSDSSIDNPPSQTHATSARPEQEEVAILGGGITGLASAFYLSKELPNAEITLYEASEKLGGWLRTKTVDVATGGKVLFEQGPRTLRTQSPAGILTYLMVKELGLQNELIFTPNTAPAAINRYVYYPDRLVTMPNPCYGIFSNLRLLSSEPVFKGIFTSLAFEAPREPRPANLEDESVGSFLRRRFGRPEVGDNIVSAVLHGIYAGDIEQLSVKSLFPSLWWSEGKYGSVLAGAYEGGGTLGASTEDVEITSYLRTISGPLRPTEAELKQLSNTSVYSFKNGLGCICKALEKYLKKRPNIEIRIGHKISQLEYRRENHAILIKSDDKPPKSFSRVISTLSSRTLSSLTRAKPGSSSLLPTLALTPSVTVMVVNLYYQNPNVLPVQGFGYLIPRSIALEQNPECALGVVFDSDAVKGQDTVPGTKLTVMMGGHWWDGLSSTAEAAWQRYPTEAEGASMATAVLARHLGIQEQPDHVLVSLQEECIPQYTVGHSARLNSAHFDLSMHFGGRLAVAGNSYTGVGVNDCVRAARDVAVKVKNASSLATGTATGLERFTGEVEYGQVIPPQQEEGAGS